MLSRRGPTLLKNPEFQSVLLRLFVWLMVILDLGFGVVMDYHVADIDKYQLLFSGFLLLFLSLLVSVICCPGWEARRYFSLFVDVAVMSLSIYLTQPLVSPFCLFYVWIVISYLTRYGRAHLTAAIWLGILACFTLVILITQRGRAPYEAILPLFLLGMLLLCQYRLLWTRHPTRQAAELSDRAKQRVLSRMFHGLWTSLDGIVARSRLLGEGTLNSDQREYGESITTSAALLEAWIAEGLDPFMLDTGRVEPTPEWLDIRSLCRTVSLSLSSQAADKGVELICRVDEQLPAVVGYDQLRFCQLLSRLLSHALKFTAANKLELSAKRLSAETSEEDTLLIVIRDGGAGIDEPRQQKLLKRFWHQDGSAALIGQGEVGLEVMASRLTGSRRGDVGMVSGQGVGLCIFLRLPLAGKVRRDLPNRLGPAWPVPSFGNWGVLSFPVNVLMAEDNTINAMVLSALLEHIGCCVTWAKNGEEALAMVATDRYDIAFIDLGMPKLDGLGFACQHRAEERGERRLPIIALTANTSSNIRSRCMAVGMDGFLDKPVDEKMLRKTILQYAASGGCDLKKPLSEGD